MKDKFDIDWEGFRERKFAVWCDTKEEAEAFMKGAIAEGFSPTYRMGGATYSHVHGKIIWTTSAGYFLKHGYAEVEMDIKDFTEAAHFDENTFTDMLGG